MVAKPRFNSDTVISLKRKVFRNVVNNNCFFKISFDFSEVFKIDTSSYSAWASV